MNFDLIRVGWPNTAAILALAMMPIVALTTATNRPAAAVQTEQIEPATICLAPAECAAGAAADTPETILQ